MTDPQPNVDETDRVLVIGAGIGGLAAALRLQCAGFQVDVLERAAEPGGKMRTLPSAAGPVDAGPTVLTMRHVFDDLFALAGARLDDHVTLVPQDILARHFWPGGARLDLTDDPERNAAAIAAFSSRADARAFRAFSAEAARLFAAFDAPMMRAAEPSLPGLAAEVLRRPALWPAMAPWRSLAGSLERRFADPRLAQLFGRYATYVGGSPYRAPALLGLIWQAEAAGVWVVRGGMHGLARAVADLARARGARFHFGADVARIDTRAGRVDGVTLADGRRLFAGRVVFNGDPRALATGRLGADVAGVAPLTARRPRSLSARVWSFAARPRGVDLAHHNVFFTADPKREFDALERGEMPDEQTLYLCAEDRGQGVAPPELERFEIILNAAPLSPGRPSDEDFARCQTLTFRTLRRFGLRFDPVPGPDALTTPQGFETLFPGSAGSLYGQSPHGLTAGLERPTARTAVPGLYLAGGGAHPGAGVPMAALSGTHAAATIVTDRASTSTFRRTATPGGMSTGSVTTVVGPSRSSVS